jgi:hypothetical protein
MRLTLRTLLAYLDDTLEPAQARLIGQKVAESEVARQLIERIKEVTRRRRLTTPPATGPGAKFDPNTVAEYLDNALPADKLAEVEEVCLTSDVHLAEIAACHQILTLVVGEPARVPPTARQRMYGLIKGREAIPYRKAVPSGIRPAEPLAPHVEEEADETLLLGLPFYRRQGPWLRWVALPLLVLALIAALVVAVWQAIPSRGAGSATGWGTRAAASNSPRPDTRREKPAEVSATDKADARDVRPPEGTGRQAPDKPEQGAPVEKQPAEKAGPGAAVKPALEVVPVDKPSPDRLELAKFVSLPGTPGVLLQRPADQPHWQRVKPEERLSTTNLLVTLPGYRAEVRLDSGIRLLLWGNLQQFSEEPAQDVPVRESGIVLHAPPAPLDGDFTVDRGRLVISNHKPAGAARVRVRFHDEIWDLTLADNETEVGLELWGIYRPGTPFRKEPRPDEVPYEVAGLFVLKGHVTLRTDYQVFNMPAPEKFIWDNYHGSAAAGPQPLQPLPDWWTSRGLPKKKAGKEMLLALDDFEQQLRKKGQPMDVALAELRQDGPRSARVLSVWCLAAIDAVPQLVDALDDAQHAEVRQTAVDALRHWVSRAKDQDMKLYNFLVEQKKYSPAQGEITLQLLHPLSVSECYDPATYEVLIAHLLHDKLPIRELAYWHLSRIVLEGAKIPYDAAGTSTQRERAFKQWKALIPNGKLPPRFAKAAGGNK